MIFNGFNIIYILLLTILFNINYNTSAHDICNKNWTDCENPWITKLQQKKFNNDLNNINFNFGEQIKQTNFDIPWFLNIPILPVLFATSPTLPNGHCKRQAQRYLQELRNGTLWAAKMYDSSAKYPDGIIDGHVGHLGNFDECYNLKVKIPSYDDNNEYEEISGNYCLVKIEYQQYKIPINKHGPHTLDFDPNGSVWEAIQEKGDFRRANRKKMEMALCVPATCSADDIKQALSKPLEIIGKDKQILVTTGIRANTCQTQGDEPEFSNAAKVYCYVILGLFLFTGLGTWYDVSKNKIYNEQSKKNDADVNDDNDVSIIGDVLCCFSVKRNFKSITDITYTHPGLDSIHFIRFLFMCMAIFGHRMMEFYKLPVTNSRYLEETYKWRWLIVMYNGPIIIEVFFAIGGLLVAYFLLTELDKTKKLNFMAAIFIRYLSPTCSDNWWTNMLYINNYVNVERFCMFQTWYLAVDYHLYIMALVAVYLFWKMPRKIGYPFLISIIIIGCTVPFYVTYYQNVPPLWLGLPYLRDIREIKYFVEHYVKTHERIPSYFVGVVAGAIIYDHSLSPWRLAKVWSRTLIILFGLVLSTATQSMAWKWYDPNYIATPLESALYSSLSRPAFAMSIIAIIVLLTIGDGLETYHAILKPRWVQPLARLGYGAYLIHNILQIYDLGFTRQTRTFSFHTGIFETLTDLIVTFSISLLLSLTIEGPFRRLEKRFIMKQKHKKTTIKKDTVIENNELAKKIN
ncbi:hypothetical protein HCN44_004372 [Aphidius gifuensis]|uniref:Nose resistant-to-fluoxetine protein N-terminal domain-containing protein n=1 Tax=Aphidius gifuensis TaxID=684658 RepID=A0A834XZG6_APHGI|nr:hypothetical protein HCN44_004372 [Aphidius gifuensis]